MRSSEMEFLTVNGNPLETLERVFPDFIEEVKGLTICDYGCGEGKQVAELSKHAAYVMGVDINIDKCPKPLSNVAFVTDVKARPCNFDVVISQNAMEHFEDPELALLEMKCMLKPRGRIFLTFGPPWYAPYGAHMFHFTNIPWVHLLMPEWLLMKWRSKYRKDGAKRYEEVEGGLNRMTVARFEKAVNDLGLELLYEKVEAVKGLKLLAALPFVREFFTNHISVILYKGE